MDAAEFLSVLLDTVACEFFSNATGVCALGVCFNLPAPALFARDAGVRAARCIPNFCHEDALSSVDEATPPAARSSAAVRRHRGCTRRAASVTPPHAAAEAIGS